MALGLQQQQQHLGTVAFTAQGCVCWLCRSGGTTAPGSAPLAPASQLPLNQNHSLPGHCWPQGLLPSLQPGAVHITAEAGG